ncbi:MAG: pyridoxal phosphate-dependent aminotransferase [Bacteroidia bacterium]|nr:pyridoxal phosphate-dependent aminotransferase [Bacteroidia bacterium]
MPGLSQRGQQMPESPIRKLVPYAEAAKKKGVHVYHLNIGQPDIETPPVFFEAIAKANLKVVEYSHSAGLESFRQAVLDYYERKGIHGLGQQHIITTTGASEALRFAFMSCFDPGDEVIIPEPFYANYNGFALEAGVKVVPITTRIEENFDLPEIEEFQALITPRTRAILICNPSNPTGKLYDLDDLEKLRDVVKKHNLYLFADEVYREFAYDGRIHHSTLNLEGIEENVVVFDSISKRFSACGARVGSLISRNSKFISVAMKYAQARLSPPTLGQIGAEAMYKLPDSYYQIAINEYVSRRDCLFRALGEIPGVMVPHVSGAFYMVVRLPVDDADKFCQWMLESFSFEGGTCMMAPAAGFYATPGLGRDEVRIAYVLKESELEKAMKCLAAGLLAYPGTTVPELSGKKAN